MKLVCQLRYTTTRQSTCKGTVQDGQNTDDDDCRLLPLSNISRTAEGGLRWTAPVANCMGFQDRSEKSQLLSFRQRTLRLQSATFEVVHLWLPGLYHLQFVPRMPLGYRFQSESPTENQIGSQSALLLEVSQYKECTRRYFGVSVAYENSQKFLVLILFPCHIALVVQTMA